MKLWARLDRYGADDPDFNEGFPEDRCPVCERPVIDHFDPTRCVCGDVNYVHYRDTDECSQCECDRFRSRRGGPAKWPHRYAAAIDLLTGLFD